MLQQTPFPQNKTWLRQLGEQGPGTGNHLGLALEAKAEESPLIPQGSSWTHWFCFFFRDGEPEEATETA